MSDHPQRPYDSKPTLLHGRDMDHSASKDLGEEQPPIRCWDQYELKQFLGKGGMGRVFKAVDTRLKRTVAIKFLKDHDPQMIVRFIREARAQARVEHPNVCKVHEVGEVEGMPFIAMQYISGEPFHIAATNITLEESLQAMKSVAEGVHEAHRVGLIHRDLKPANILVDETKSGEIHPVVLDFGLARWVTEQGLTMDGSTLGTPSFMAPEQVLGEIELLDRRTDVYALGATLYALLTGKPPFTDSSQAVIFRDILEKEVVKPSQHQPRIPRDVETIILKALEKAPKHRYQSALAFAQDLGRYLDGEPIHARPTSWFYRLGKKARKNKLGFSLAAAATLLLLITFIWGLRTTWQASLRERLARDSATKVKEMETLARLSHMSPRHDIRPDRARLLNLLRNLQSSLGQAPKLARGPTHYALGSGFLALGDLAKAKHHLDQAWSQGYQDPAVAYALGLVYSELFREHLAQNQLIQDETARRSNRETLNNTYRDPALAFMKQVPTLDIAAPAYLQALIAYCENRPEDSLRSLDAAKKEQPWLYEVQRLEGDLYRDRAWLKGESGKLDEARVDFEKSLTSYAKASEIAPSDPQSYKQASWALILMMQTEMFRQKNLDPLLARGIQQTEWAIDVLPEDDEAWRLRARIFRGIAQNRRLAKDSEAITFLEKAAKAAQKATELNPTESKNRLQLGLIYWAFAKSLGPGNDQHAEYVAKAQGALQAVSEEQRDYVFYYTSGQSYKSLANNQVKAKQDPCENLERAVKAFSKAITLQPSRIENYNSLANAYLTMARVRTCPGRSLRQLQEDTIAVLDRAIVINPEHPVLLYQSGRAYQRMARGDTTSGWMLDEALAEKALDRYGAARAQNPQLWFVYNGLGWVHLMVALSHTENGKDPMAHFQSALEAYATGIDTNPNAQLLIQNQAWVRYYLGKFLVRTGKDPNKTLVNARLGAEKNLAQKKNVDMILCVASALRIQAESAMNQNKDPSQFMNLAAHQFQNILQMAPDFAEGHRSLGRLFTLRARWRISQGKDPTLAFQKAQAAMEKALEHQPRSLFFVMAMARLHLQRSLYAHAQEWQQNPHIEPGLQLISLALELRPGYSEATVIQACFWRIQVAQGTQDAQTPSLAHIKDQFQTALKTNSHLNQEWLPWFLP